MASSSLWQRFQQYFLRYDDLGFSIDISRMKFPDDFLGRMSPKIDKAFATMRDLEAGGIANPDEKRMFGHYWLRKPALAPNAELRTEIENTNARIKKFAADVHGGKIKNARGEKFQHLLSLGIGGSALGPEFFQKCRRDYRSRKRSRYARGEKRLAGAFSNVGLGRRPDIGNERGWA